MIVVDWGSSSLRGYRLDGMGAIMERRASTNGTLVCEGRFEQALVNLTNGWPLDEGVLLAGMVGSKHGWVETDYVPCPATSQSVAQSLVAIPGGISNTFTAYVVPGVSKDFGMETADVMRGEEVQVFGLIASRGISQGTVCLPGTHSKWVEVSDGEILNFKTAMTGELYAVLLQHSILGLLAVEAPLDRESFIDGLEFSKKPGGLLHHLFSVRAQPLTGFRESASVKAYLSGLLIGHEIAAQANRGMSSIWLIGDAQIVSWYALALNHFGLEALIAEPDLAARGLYVVAQLSGRYQ